MTRMDRELWDAQEVAGDLVAAGSVFAFLAEHRRELFDDSFTADLFGSPTGRPSLPAGLVGAVVGLQELFDPSGGATADGVGVDLRLKVGLGRAVTGAVCAVDCSRRGRPDIDWDDPAARQALVSALVNDALAVLAELCRPEAGQWDAAAADALGLLALVAGQDVEPAEDSDGTDGRWVIA